MRVVVGLLYVFAALGALAGALEILSTFQSAISAPQQAALAARAAAFAVVPYVFARAVEGMSKPWPSTAVTVVPSGGPHGADESSAVDTQKNAAAPKSPSRRPSVFDPQ